MATQANIVYRKAEAFKTIQNALSGVFDDIPSVRNSQMKELLQVEAIAEALKKPDTQKPKESEPKEYTKADLEKVNRKADLVVIADKVGAKVVPDDQTMKEMRQVILEAQK